MLVAHHMAAEQQLRIAGLDSKFT